MLGLVSASPVLLAWSNNPNLSIPDLADRLFGRVADTNWVVVFKAMIVCHELMGKGGEVGLHCVTCYVAHDSFVSGFVP